MICNNTTEASKAKHLFFDCTKQLAISCVIQSVAISAFALYGSVTVVCTLTAAGFAVAALTMIPSVSENAAGACRFLANFGVIHLIYELGLNTFIHEMGHALAGAALFRGKHPTIEIDFFSGGNTITRTGKLSALGSLIGKDRAQLIVAAAGPIASLVFAMGMFAWATYQSDEVMAQRMNIQGGVQLFDEIHHAYKYFAARVLSPGNDYGKLQHLAGISPAASLGILILFPTIQLLWINKKAVKKKIENIFSFTASIIHSAKRSLSFSGNVFANDVIEQHH